MAAERVGVRLGDHRTPVYHIMQLNRRHYVRGAVVGKLHFQMLMAQITTRDRIQQLQQSEIVHVRRVHLRADHETTARLRNIRAVLQIVERGVAERGLHLGRQIVAVRQHLQAYVELTRRVGQRKIMDGDRVPCSLL